MTTERRAQARRWVEDQGGRESPRELVVMVSELIAALDAAEKERDEVRAHVLSQTPICGNHWEGLSGVMIDGSDGCPWCHVAKLQDEVSDADEQLTAVEAALEVAREALLHIALCELAGHGGDHDTAACDCSRSWYELEAKEALAKLPPRKDTP